MSEGSPEPVLRTKPLLDDNLGRIVPHSFPDWNGRFDRTAQRGDGLRARDQFALTGQYKLENAAPNHRGLRAGLDMESCRIPRDMYLTTVCDIDSVIGIVAGDFPIDLAATFTYYMLPDVKHTLSADLHISPVRVRDEHQNEDLILPHKIPNARFGTLGRLVVRLALPALVGEDGRARMKQPNYVGERYLRLLYDRAIQPATMTTLPEDVRRQWPQRYSNEMFRAAPHRGPAAEAGGRQPQQTGREVHGHDFNAWITEIRRRIAGDAQLAFAVGFLLMVEGKGLKNVNGSAHPTPENPLADAGTSSLVLRSGDLFDMENPRTMAIQSVLADLDPASFAPNEWYLDIATTVSARAHGPDGNPVCLMVNSNAHPELIHHFSGAPIGECERWVRTNGGGYQRDELAHVAHFAGFRISFAEPAAHGLEYLQVYTTDKSIAYRTDGPKKAKHTSPYAVLTDWQNVHDHHCLPLAQAFLDSSASHPSAVRAESRMKFEGYPYVHRALARRIICPCLYYVRCSAWWGYRWRKAISMTNVLNRFMGATEARKKLVTANLPETGSLLVIVVWMLNALVNRPDDGGYYDEISHAGSVHAVVDEAVVPVSPLGMYCLHSLRLSRDDSKVPRISTHRTLTTEKVVYFCSSSHENLNSAAVLRLFRAGAGKRVREPHDPWRLGGDDDRQDVVPPPPRRPNKQRRVCIRPVGDAPDVLAGRIAAVDRGARYSSEDEDEEEREAPVSWSQRVSDVVHAFPIQIFAKAPNRSIPRGGGKNAANNRDEDEDEDGSSWCTLKPEELADITSDIFADLGKPADIFVSHHDFGRDYDKWTNTVNMYFPTCEEREAMPRKIQGLSQLSVWEDWRALLEEAPPNVAAQMVREARQLVNTEWGWLPWCTKDHLWATGKATKRGRQVGDIHGGPWIVYNPRFRARG
ncbi:hypothetical protein FRC08_008236 [Ceratobasidium sp. 394]|nr:hypothetical protein FRC08_008236 [Ceratobasidium sp. 394]